MQWSGIFSLTSKALLWNQTLGGRAWPATLHTVTWAYYSCTYPWEEPRPSEAEPGLKFEGLTSWSHKAWRQIETIKPMFFRIWFTHHLHQHHSGCLLKILFLGAHPTTESVGVGPRKLDFTSPSQCYLWLSSHQSLEQLLKAPGLPWMGWAVFW